MVYVMVTNPETMFMGPTWGPPGSCRPTMGPCWPHEHCFQGNCTDILRGHFVLVSKNKRWYIETFEKTMHFWVPFLRFYFIISLDSWASNSMPKAWTQHIHGCLNIAWSFGTLCYLFCWICQTDVSWDILVEICIGLCEPYTRFEKKSYTIRSLWDSQTGQKWARWEIWQCLARKKY